MKHPSRASTRDARSRPRVAEFGESQFAVAPSEQAKASARAGALHGFVLAVGILLVVVPIILITNGCASEVIAAELSIPGVFLGFRWVSPGDALQGTPAASAVFH